MLFLFDPLIICSTALETPEQSVATGIATPESSIPPNKPAEKNHTVRVMIRLIQPSKPHPDSNSIHIQLV